jgi:chaperonin GroEL
MDDAEHAYSQKGETLENCGYNVVKKTFVNMVEDGIIDPAEVVINEVQNASSVSGLLLTTDCLSVEMPDDKTGMTPSACPPGGCSSGMPMM